MSKVIEVGDELVDDNGSIFRVVDVLLNSIVTKRDGSSVSDCIVLERTLCDKLRLVKKEQS